MSDTAVQQWTQEQVERLARDFMGWKTWETGMPASGTYAVYVNGLWVYHGNSPLCDQVMFSPFTAASADYQVLQRARQTWGHSHATTVEAVAWHLFCQALAMQWRDRAYRDDDSTHPARYEVGDYARAVLAVLDSQKGAGQCVTWFCGFA